jgi:hypothetical protein
MHAANPADAARRVTSVVRADSRTGHLVRTVVVSPKVVSPKLLGEPAAIEPALQRNSTDIDEIVQQTAKAYEVDPALVHSIIKVESNYNPRAVSNKGAQGLMQLVPATAKSLGVKDSFNPRENIEGGVRYYKYLKSIFKDDRLALAAYNAGEGAVAKYNFQVPPYPETMNYVYQVGKRWGEANRQRRAQSTPPPEVKPVAEGPKVEEHPRLEQYRDDQGRIYIRTARQ